MNTAVRNQISFTVTGPVAYAYDWVESLTVVKNTSDIICISTIIFFYESVKLK